MGFQLHFFFGVKEVFFFQFPKDPSLGLRIRCDLSQTLAIPNFISAIEELGILTTGDSMSPHL